MDGSAIGAVAAHDQLGRFTTGNTEYRAKQKRLAERLAQLRLEFDPSPLQLQLLRVACRHLDDAERGRSALVRTRASNAARRLLADVPRKSEPSLPATLEEYLADE